MTKRHFQNWIDIYVDYARDGFCPDSFHLWTGLSILSGALERKVWIKEGLIQHYPNTFVLLVANPGVGKSTAIKRGTSLLEDIKLIDPNLKVMSGLMTQAGLMSEMKTFKMIDIRGKGVPMTSGYYYASEASDSGLQNLSGDFNATVTALYDCDDQYRKRLKNEEYTFPNPSLCILAGSTFDFLKNLVNQNSVMGGLASRFLYVVERERPEHVSTWGSSGLVTRSPEMRMRLYEDLRHIHSLVGEFRIEGAAIDLYNDWHADFMKHYRAIESERMQSIMTRVPTALKKVLMLCSVAERSDLSITREHMEKAIELTESVRKDNAMIISSAIMANKSLSESLFQFLGQSLKKSGGIMSMQNLSLRYAVWGGDPTKFESTLAHMVGAGMIKREGSAGSTECLIRLLIDPDTQL